MTTVVSVERPTKSSYDLKIATNQERGSKSAGKALLAPGFIGIAIVSGLSGASAVNSTSAPLVHQVVINSSPHEYNGSDPNNVESFGPFEGEADEMAERTDFTVETIYDDISYSAKPARIFNVQEDINIIKGIRPDYAYSEENLLKDDISYEAKPKRVFKL